MQIDKQAKLVLLLLLLLLRMSHSAHPAVLEEVNFNQKILPSKPVSQNIREY